MKLDYKDYLSFNESFKESKEAQDNKIKALVELIYKINEDFHKKHEEDFEKVNNEISTLKHDNTSVRLENDNEKAKNEISNLKEKLESVTNTISTIQTKIKDKK